MEYTCWCVLSHSKTRKVLLCDCVTPVGRKISGSNRIWLLEWSFGWNFGKGIVETQQSLKTLHLRWFHVVQVMVLV